MKGLVSLIINICIYASPSFHWFAYTSLFVKCSVADKDWGADFRKLSAGSALVGLTLWLDHMQANSPLFFFFSLSCLALSWGCHVKSLEYIFMAIVKNAVIMFSLLLLVCFSG